MDKVIKKEQKEINEARFKEVYEILRSQLLEASVSFDIFEKIWPTEKVVDILNQYIGFFQPTRLAHLDRFIIKISNVLDNKQSSPSFYNIINNINKFPDLAPGLNVHKIKRRIRSHREALEEIKDYRNKRAAHWDTTVIQPKPVIYGKSKKLLKELINIYNEISSSHSHNQWSFSYSQHRDTEALLERLIKVQAEYKKLIKDHKGVIDTAQ